MCSARTSTLVRSWHSARQVPLADASDGYLRRVAPTPRAVLILPPGHAIGRSLSRRERWMVGGVLGVVAALAVALVISLLSAGPSSGHGCIYATIPGAV